MEKTKNGITEGVIWKQLLLFFFPILIGTFFQQLYNTVDTIIVGQFVGTEALAAVGTTGTVINLLVGFFVGVASGATRLKPFMERAIWEKSMLSGENYHRRCRTNCMRL